MKEYTTINSITTIRNIQFIHYVLSRKPKSMILCKLLNSMSKEDEFH